MLSGFASCLSLSTLPNASLDNCGLWPNLGRGGSWWGSWLGLELDQAVVLCGLLPLELTELLLEDAFEDVELLKQFADLEVLPVDLPVRIRDEAIFAVGLDTAGAIFTAEHLESEEQTAVRLHGLGVVDRVRSLETVGARLGNI